MQRVRMPMVTFTMTHDISQYTKAKVFQPGTTTEIFMRFSTVALELGADDAELDIHLTACKFYTDDGNLDMVYSGTTHRCFLSRTPTTFRI